MGLWFKVEHSAGGTFEETARDLAELANRLGIQVVVTINVTMGDMFALPGEDGETVFERWKRLRG